MSTMDEQMVGQLRALESELEGLKAEQVESKRQFNEMRGQLAALQSARQDRRLRMLALDHRIRAAKLLLGVASDGNKIDG